MVRPRQSSRRPRRPAEARVRRKNRIGAALIGAVAAVLLGAFYVYQTLDQARPDPVTGCYPDRTVSLTVVMIDGSDPIAPRQQAFLRNHLEAIKAEVPRGGALEVYRLGTDTESLLKPVVSVCNPGHPDQADPWTESPERARRVWEEAFQSRLQEVFDDLLDPIEEEFSPIFESIQSIGITTFASPQWQDKPKRLILISDLLQFTSEFSHYQGPGEFDSFRNTPYYRRVRTDLSNVEVTAFYLPRATRNRVQGPAHIEFWKEYLLDQGARPGRPAFFVHVEG